MYALWLVVWFILLSNSMKLGPLQSKIGICIQICPRFFYLQTFKYLPIDTIFTANLAFSMQ